MVLNSSTNAGTLRDFLVRKQRMRTLSDQELSGQIDQCLVSNSCIEDAFRFRIKDRIRRKRFPITYEPEDEGFGLDHGVFTEKDINQALDDVKGLSGFDSHPYDENNIRRAIERAGRLVEAARAEQDRRRDIEAAETDNELTGVVKERRR